MPRLTSLLALCCLTLLLVPASLAHAADKAKIVIIGGRDSHGASAHNWGDGADLLAKALNEESGLPVHAVVHKGGYPNDASIFDGAKTVVILCDGGGRHLLLRHLDAFKKIMDRGAGLVNVHYAVEVPKGQAGDLFLQWVGGYFETHWSVNPHWKAEFLKMPKHPITQGVKPFELNDEWYYHMRFRTQMKGVTPILSALPPEATLKRRDGAHSGNPHVRKAVLERMEPQHVAWAYQRPNDVAGGGRGFGITGAHYHKSWDNDSFRTCVLNAIVWTAGLDVPDGGVKSLPNPTARLAGKSPSSKTPTVGGALKPAVAAKHAAFASPVVTKKTPGHAVDVKADIKGKTDLFLVVTDGGNGYSCDWSNWAEPRLVGPTVEKKLTELKWSSAGSQWGNVRVNQNAGGGAMRIAGKPIAYGIGTHANSVIHFKLPKNHGYTHFVARAGLDNGGTDQGNCGESASVQFLVVTEEKSLKALAFAKPSGSGQPYVKKTNAPGRDAGEAVASLDVHEDLQVELFAAEPMLTNPSNIDIDHTGRVWVAEIVNYRRHRGKQPEGDRILILEDTDGDGKADKRTVFLQTPEIMSPHGICVLATPDFKGTRVIVSAGDTVWNVYDDDGDGKADRKEKMFTGIAGSQHDHGIHAFVFGPDGKLYFNFGNTGKQIRDKDGKPIVDKAGNVVNASRKPYQEGMVFRCNLDGSEFETLGWNFRNNWMTTVDSFGSIWQSDNDDDGNKAVRINYVMEYGNYGYKDEFTGKGWRDKRVGMHPEVPHRHWHINDPGVVPNLLLTGAGSPTGITVYEGTLLPKVFQGQVLHTDAGPNVARAYPVQTSGAGYTSRMENILSSTRDRWFRPSDVSVAPDGSIIVADWYDPGVGGHGAGDLEKGRLFRVTPTGHKGYKNAKIDVSTIDGAIAALRSPNYTARYVAWQALHKQSKAATSALLKVFKSDPDARQRARALWLLGKIDTQHAQGAVDMALEDKDTNIRITGIRLARQTGVDLLPHFKYLAKDKSSAVRREVAVAIRDLTHRELNDDQDARLAEVWVELALQHDGKDRWYLEALGIAAERRWDLFFAAWQKRVSNWSTPAGRDIVWRARTKAALPLLAKILTDANTPKDQRDRYVRTLDFHPKSPEKDKAMQAVLGL